jgi:SH3-like domain-containing protein
MKKRWVLPELARALLARALLARALLAGALLAGAPAALAAGAVTRTVLKTTTSVVHAHGKTVVETHQTVRVTRDGKTTIIHTVSRKVSGGGALAGAAPKRPLQVAAAAHKPAVVSARAGHHERVKRVAKAAAVAAPVVVAAAPPPPPPPPDPAKGTDSGLPLPRFAALRSDEVSLRAGPGTRYPIEWVYQRKFLPVEIEREFEVWRLVSEPDGTKGWVHEAMLTGRRGFLIDGDQPQTMRAGPSDTAAAVAVLKPGVVGRLTSCPAAGDWCQVSVKTYAGWLPRTAFWGTLPSETVQQ